LTSPDCASGTDRIEEAARALGLTDEIIINVQGDEPLMTGAVIDAVIRVLREKHDAMVATAVSRLRKTEELGSPNVVKAVLSTSGSALYFSRAAIPFHRDLGTARSGEWLKSASYFKHIGIYGYRLAALKRFVELPEGTLEKIERLEQLRFMEAGIQIQTTLVDYDSVAVDTAEDVRAVELILAERSLG
jgi:3-deoxy-manno-octulosonate cytidylyltransferase (CMP-KDO synthetase)